MTADILSRLRALSGADRAVDIEIVMAFGTENEHGVRSCAGYLGIAMFTASVDAALALVERVLPGINWEVTKTSACLYTDCPDCGHSGYHTHPAIAILIALFEALKAKEGTADE
jgi:hypothetical protein